MAQTSVAEATTSTSQLSITDFTKKDVPNIQNCSGCFCPVALLPANGVADAFSEDEIVFKGRRQARYYCEPCTEALNALY